MTSNTKVDPKTDDKVNEGVDKADWEPNQEEKMVEQTWAIYKVPYINENGVQMTRDTRVKTEDREAFEKAHGL